MSIRFGAVFGLVVMICGCSGSSTDGSDYDSEAAIADYPVEDDATAYLGEESSEREAFDEDAARDAAEDEVSSESYSSIGAPYGCSGDCSGHEAGFEWRRDNGYAADGNSQSFAEGGQAFDQAVEDRVEEMRSDYEAGGEPEY